MSNTTTEVLQVTPYMDIELLLANSQESRIAGDVMDRLVERWGKWMGELNAKRINIGKDSYLVVWLSEVVEEDVDEIWDEKPSEAFLYNALAQTMCMCSVYELIPEVVEAGCAPAPKPTLDLKTALEAEMLRDEDSEDTGLALTRRYAVATYFPFRGGCDVCALSDSCPKLQGGSDYSVTLPGYEQ